MKTLAVSSTQRSNHRFVKLVLLTRVCFIVLAVSTLILPPSLIPDVVTENTSSLAFAIPPSCGSTSGDGPGCIDSDGDNIPDQNDVCPDDPRNRCYLKCDGFLRCIGTFLDWAFRNFLQGIWRIAQNVWISIVGGNPDPYDGYESPFERACKDKGGVYFDGEGHGLYGGDVYEYCYFEPGSR